ncbi:hypothetical protein RvY_01798 [Ramazzottius varieornatus]|uniref:Uncharacterized protein n=1 Tax=Ramazzottius varieornatus TaxID=947166 RepID=A0A1D1UIF0_RAMVA|nr:hypothetical protein RvY_01798 [Ramazzottius varieornatus]
MDIDSEVECVSDGEHEEDDQREREEVRPSGYTGSIVGIGSDTLFQPDGAVVVHGTRDFGVALRLSRRMEAENTERRLPMYSGSLDFPSWEFFPAYCGVLGAFPFTELDMLKLLPCRLEGRAVNYLNAQSDIMPFNLVGLSEVPAVKPGDPVHFRYWYEHFWEVVQAGFLLDLHGAWFGECLQLCMDRDDVERCMEYLDEPPD